MTEWVADGTASLLTSVGRFVDGATAPDVGASWFEAHYRVMGAIATLLVLPLLLGAAVSAVIRQDPGTLLRAVAVHLPVAALGTAVAVKVVQVVLGATDELCRLVLGGSTDDPTPFLSALGTNLQRSARQSDGAAFAVVVVAIVMAAGAFAVITELVVRSAAVYVALLFLPLALAGLVWPATLRWARRLVEVLAVLILSKFVVVAVLSLASSALQASFTGGGLPALIGGGSLLVLAAFAPYALLRLVPVIEAGSIAHLEGIGQRGPVGGAIDRGWSLRELLRDRADGFEEGGEAGPGWRTGARPEGSSAGQGNADRLAASAGARRRVGSWSEFGAVSGSSELGAAAGAPVSATGATGAVGPAAAVAGTETAVQVVAGHVEGAATAADELARPREGVDGR